MFCSNCGNQLSDDAKFCPSCGTAVTAQNSTPVYSAPEVKPAENQDAVYASPSTESFTQEEHIYNTPNIEPASGLEAEAVPAMSAATHEPSNADSAAYTNQTPVQNDFNQQFAGNQFNQAPAQNDFNRQFAGNQFNQATSQSGFNQQMYSGAQMYAQGGAQSQPAYQNPMGMAPDNSQNWGPLMPPKKKSKAPIIITLSVLALLIVVGIVVCCLFFCGGSKKGSSSAQAAIENTIDAISKNDSEAVIDTLYPLYDSMLDAFLDVEGEYAEDAKDYREYMIEGMLDDMKPVDGKFTYSDLNLETTDTASNDDLEEFDSLYDEFQSQFASLDIDLGDKEDYDIEAAVRCEGTVTINAGGESDDFYIDATVVKCNGSWYVMELYLY